MAVVGRRAHADASITAAPKPQVVSASGRFIREELHSTHSGLTLGNNLPKGCGTPVNAPFVALLASLRECLKKHDVPYHEEDDSQDNRSVHHD